MVLVRALARRVLLTTTWTHKGNTRTLFEWLSMLADTARRYVNPPMKGGELPHIVGKSFLGIDPINGEYEYKLSFDLEGISGDIGVGAQAFRGPIKVQQVKPTVEPADTYHCFLVGLSAGVGAGIKTRIRSEGIARSHVEWQPSDFLAPSRRSPA